MFISYAPFLFYRLNGGIHRISFVYYSFRFHSFSEVRSQNKSQNLPSVFFFFFFFLYIFIFFTFFFLFGHSSKPSSFCTLLYRAYSHTHTIIHVHAHTRTRFPPILHTYNTFFRLHYLSYTLSYSLSLSFSRSFLLSPIYYTVSLLLHLSFSLEEKRAMSDKPSHMNAYTTHISILNQYGNSKFGEFLGAFLRQ